MGRYEMNSLVNAPELIKGLRKQGFKVSVYHERILVPVSNRLYGSARSSHELTVGVIPQPKGGCTHLHLYKEVKLSQFASRTEEYQVSAQCFEGRKPKQQELEACRNQFEIDDLHTKLSGDLYNKKVGLNIAMQRMITEAPHLFEEQLHADLLEQRIAEGPLTGDTLQAFDYSDRY